MKQIRYVFIITSIINILLSCRADDEISVFKTNKIENTILESRVPLLLKKNKQASFEILIKDNIKVDEISVNFGNFNRNELNPFYNLGISVESGLTTFIDKKFLNEKILDNQWHSFDLNGIDLIPGIYVINISNHSNNKLVIWTNNQELLFKINHNIIPDAEDYIHK